MQKEYPTQILYNFIMYIDKCDSCLSVAATRSEMWMIFRGILCVCLSNSCGWRHCVFGLSVLAYLCPRLAGGILWLVCRRLCTLHRFAHSVDVCMCRGSGHWRVRLWVTRVSSSLHRSWRPTQQSAAAALMIWAPQWTSTTLLCLSSGSVAPHAQTLSLSHTPV